MFVPNHYLSRWPRDCNQVEQESGAEAAGEPPKCRFPAAAPPVNPPALHPSAKRSIGEAFRPLSAWSDRGCAPAPGLTVRGAPASPLGNKLNVVFFSPGT